LKLAIGARVWLTRRADAQPLALRVLMRIIRCVDHFFFFAISLYRFMNLLTFGPTTAWQ
jgi:hypothetical protein